MMMLLRKRKINIRRFHSISESFKHACGQAKSLADWYQIRRQFRALLTVYADIPFNEWVSFPQGKLRQYIDDTIAQKKREGSLSPTDIMASIVYETEEFRSDKKVYDIEIWRVEYMRNRRKERKQIFFMIRLFSVLLVVALIVLMPLLM